MQKIAITEIKVSDRVRRDLGNIEELAASMLRIGQLQPIVIDQDNRLIAGGRRLAAAIHNGWQHIEYISINDLDPISRREAELEENVRRKDLTWQEEVTAIKSLYDLRVDKYGENLPVAGANTYSLRDAEKDMERSAASLSLDIQLANALTKYPELSNEPTKKAAFRRFKREEETRIRTEQARRTHVKADTPSPSEGAQSEARAEGNTTDQGQALKQPIRKVAWKGKGILYLADSRDVLRLYTEKSVDCIVTDPPFALGMFAEGSATSNTRLAENAGHMYDDDPSTVLDMLDQIFAHAAKVLKSDGHAYIFFHHTKYEEMYTMIRKHFGTCEETPIVWIKNTPGIGDPNRSWVYAYEPCFFVNRGRQLVKPQAFNYLKYDTVPPAKKIHPTQKPDALLRHIISASCIEGEVVLDPFAGSGSTLVAASQVGCRFIGIEREEKFHRIATDRIAEEIATGQPTQEVANA